MSEDNSRNKSESALKEERVLEFWKQNKIFEKSLEKKSPKGEFIFYEGPPTANGKPGIHHLEARAFKDVIPRYKTMRGYHVRRKAGWDTHGLPVELEVERELGLKSKKEIEEFGISEFNQRCKKSAWTYVDLWEKFTERMGFWIDQKNPYITYENNYIESVWNVVKEADKQSLLYKDYKVVPWCPRCETGLSSHEMAQGYEDIKDLSVYVKFRIVDKNAVPAGSLSAPAGAALTLGSSACERPRQEHIFTDSYILAWTTTPWTLPGNVALAVGEKINYIKIKKENEFLILAKERLSVIDGEYKIVEEMKSEDLVGLGYEPLFPFLKNQLEKKGESSEKAYKIYPANFVTTEDGTGVVHTAVMYGQDDFELGTKIGLPKYHLVGLDGKFLSGTGFLENRFVRDEDVAVDIIKDLAHRGLLLKKEKHEHPYPHCWRCKTPLIYYARDSWYIKMSALRDKLVKENESINWEPEYIKEGRFGEWLREIKDWAISRERYWGTPLPVWTCDKCKKNEVIGSIENLKSKTKKSGNKYFVMRHGEGEHQIKGIYTLPFDQTYHLTLNGKKRAEASAEKLKGKGITKIIASPVLRCQETARILSDILGVPVETDQRIHELNSGEFDEKPTEFFDTWIHSTNSYFTDAPKDGESLLDAKKRFGEFLYDLEKKYTNEIILIVSHGIAGEALSEVTEGADNARSEEIARNLKIKCAEVKELDFIPLPHNENYKLDLHKPYIDEIELVCDCGGEMKRVKEVMDVWLDSGTMPFSQDHYPFENKKLQYPADFISEAIDQTRGWFYTLHAVGILMGRGKAYKNVICLGHLLDANGKKMSKSLGNIVDPWIMMDKYGVDTLRLWMYSVNQPGESKNFDEKTVLELHRQVFGLLYNVLAFYELYRDVSLETITYNLEPNLNILDKWILARLDELTILCTEKMDNYKLLEPARAIKDFINDLSTWYLRRSRERIKNDDVEAKKTLYYVLKTLTKLMAPFVPFASEDIWQKLKTKDDEESVHLAKWPIKPFKIFSFGKFNQILENMKLVRGIVTLGLEARQKAGIKVRQPVYQLRVKDCELEDQYKYIQLIIDELNVKEIIFNNSITNEIELDSKITPELKMEGDYRELVRAIQDMRKKAGLTPSDTISLAIETNEEGEKIIQEFESGIKKTVLASEVEFKENNGEQIKIDDLVFKVKIEK